MANNTSKLKVTELDFDLLKASLKDFLKAKPEYTDWDFEGSNLSTLLDILAYNAHYQSMYFNLIANEMFIDSATLRESLVSLAKLVNYTPVSRRAATAIIDVTIDPTPSTPASIIIERGTQFSASIDSVSYDFVNLEAYTIIPASGVYKATDLVIREGVLYKTTTVVDNSIPNQRFIIPTSDVDISTIKVTVQNSIVDSETNTYILVSDFNTLTPDSLVYFIQEIENQYYEVYFGDGVLGKKLEDGNIVYVEYLATNGAAANKAGNGNTSATQFSSNGAISGFSNVTVTTKQIAYGGAERESDETIRFNAPQNYETQNRAVTVADYQAILKREYSNADSVSVWGGESNDPPIYGKVFISLKPVEGLVITQTTKEQIINSILGKYNVVSIIPEIIDPEYIFLTITSTIKYNSNITSLTSNALKALVNTAIQDFVDLNISKFNKVFRYSQLLNAIDTTEKSIISNVTNIKMRKEFQVRLGAIDRYEINFNNPIRSGTLNSNAFIVTSDPKISYNPGDEYYFQDDQNGIIQIYKIFQSKRLIVKENSGTIDYNTGKVIITDFFPNSVVDGSVYIKLTVEPTNTDIEPMRNDIITVLDSDISLTMVAETE